MRLLAILLCFVAMPLQAADVYQSPEAFVAESFDQAAPKAKTLSISGALEAGMHNIMGGHYKLANTKYWQKDGRSVWILEAIGKYKPITTGFVVGSDGKMERIKVLIYRESHGWEVKHTFFTRQFKGVGLRDEKKLDEFIDGIAGATLSVNALKKLSALALLFHREVSAGET